MLWNVLKLSWWFHHVSPFSMILIWDDGSHWLCFFLGLKLRNHQAAKGVAQTMASVHGPGMALNGWRACMPFWKVGYMGSWVGCTAFGTFLDVGHVGFTGFSSRKPREKALRMEVLVWFDPSPSVLWDEKKKPASRHPPSLAKTMATLAVYGTVQVKVPTVCRCGRERAWEKIYIYTAAAMASGTCLGWGVVTRGGGSRGFKEDSKPRGWWWRFSFCLPRSRTQSVWGSRSDHDLSWKRPVTSIHGLSLKLWQSRQEGWEGWGGESWVSFSKWPSGWVDFQTPKYHIKWEKSPMNVTITSPCWLVCSHEICTELSPLIQHQLQVGDDEVGGFFHLDPTSLKLPWIWPPAESNYLQAEGVIWGLPHFWDNPGYFSKGLKHWMVNWSGYDQPLMGQHGSVSTPISTNSWVASQNGPQSHPSNVVKTFRSWFQSRFLLDISRVDPYLSIYLSPLSSFTLGSTIPGHLGRWREKASTATWAPCAPVCMAQCLDFRWWSDGKPWVSPNFAGFSAGERG